MQNDEMIWQVVNHQFCSFKATIGKAKSDKTHFCRHPYSVTGLCNRTSCPLANSRYATIREDNGRLYLYIKTVERAHSPKNLWEKILLSRNYGKAIQQLDEHLAYFPKVLMHRNKQRLTKIHQYLIRMRKIELSKRAGKKAKMVGIHRKIDQREERRERKALVAAKIERTIEKELVERLAKGTYGDVYNFPETPYQKALDQVADADEATDTMESEEDEMQSMVEYVEDLEDSEEEEEMEDMEYMGNDDAWGHLDGQNTNESDDESENDDNDDDQSNATSSSSSSSSDDENDNNKRNKKPAKSKPKKRGPRVEIEYEEEREDAHAETMVAADW